MNLSESSVSSKLRGAPLSYRGFRLKLYAAQEAYERKRRELEARLLAYQGLCKHEREAFVRDPSGGSDSCYICEECGKVSRKPKKG